MGFAAAKGKSPYAQCQLWLSPWRRVATLCHGKQPGQCDPVTGKPASPHARLKAIYGVSVGFPAPCSQRGTDLIFSHVNGSQNGATLPPPHSSAARAIALATRFAMDSSKNSNCW